MNKNFDSDLLNLNTSVFSDLTYDDCLLLAQKNLQNNLERESLYFFEEALFGAIKINDEEKVTFALTKIGEVLNKSGKYSDAKVFCNLIFENQSLRLNFSCHSSGSCCKHWSVNVTSKDILKILKNRPDLKPDDFLMFPDNSFIEKYLASKPKDEIINANKWLFYLKKHEDNINCIFLKNNLCSIHDFKPTLCRNFPLNINPDSHIQYVHLEFLKENCHYCVEPVPFKEETIKNNLRLSKNNICSEQLIAAKLEEKIVVNNENLNRDEIIDFILESSSKKDEYLEKLTNIIQRKKSVLKIISYYFPQTELKEYIHIGIYSSGNLRALAKYLFKSLNKSEPEKINLIDQNEFLEINILKDDYKFKLNFFSEDKLSGIPPYNEKVLFINSKYNFPSGKTPLVINFDSPLNYLVIRSLGTVIKGELKRNNNIEAEAYMGKLDLIYQDLLSNSKNEGNVDVGGNTENKNLLNLINKVFINIEEFSLFDLGKADKPTLLQFLEKLDRLIENGAPLGRDINHFSYLLKKLRIYNFLNQTVKEEKLLLEIILLCVNYEYNKKKLIKTVRNLRRNYPKPIKLSICTIITELYSNELSTQNYSNVISYIKLLHEFYFTPDSEELENIYLQSLFDLGKAFLKTNNKAAAEQEFEKLLLSINDNNEKFEFLFSIADEYLEESYAEPAILYFTKALEFCNTDLLTERFLILETLIDLYFDAKDYPQSGKYIEELLLLIEQQKNIENRPQIDNYLSEKKFQGLVKLARIHYLDIDNVHDNPLLYLENLAGMGNIELFLASYFIGLLKKKLIILPIKIESIYYKFSATNHTHFKFNIFDQSVLTLIENFRDLLIINLEMKYLEVLFQQNQQIIDLFLRARLYVEFIDYQSAIIYLDKVINLLSAAENPDINILIYLKTYRGYIYELDGNIKKANKCYFEIFKSSDQKIIKKIYELSVFHLRFRGREKEINSLFLNNLFVFIENMKTLVFD